MIGKILFTFTVTVLIPFSLFAFDKLNVITSTADLANLVRVVGGEKVNVKCLTRGNQDPHFIEPRPSMVLQVKNADLLVRVGMDLDMWIQSLIDASRNSKVIFGKDGYLDVSSGIVKLEIPSSKVDASMGDIHIYGNPHYWLDPENAKLILKSILDKLCQLLPSESEYFKKNHQAYLQKLDSALSRWNERMEPFADVKIVTYHNSWPYFAKRFNLKIIDFVEPKPGIPPSPSHIVSLLEKIKNEKVKVIIVEPYFNLKVAESVAKRSGAKVVVLPPSVGGIDGVDSYLDLFEYNINKLIQSLQETGG
ncbi:MAG: metal ABC transporter substrate-binding protein [Bacteroidota bacterium]|nr:metal ABC transporter substrate-binding protein [Bacteroidota bacterium]